MSKVGKFFRVSFWSIHIIIDLSDLSVSIIKKGYDL